MLPHEEAGHMTAFEPLLILLTHLGLCGPSTHGPANMVPPRQAGHMNSRDPLLAPHTARAEGLRHQCGPVSAVGAQHRSPTACCYCLFVGDWPQARRPRRPAARLRGLNPVANKDLARYAFRRFALSEDRHDTPSRRNRSPRCLKPTGRPHMGQRSLCRVNRPNT
jgi:hypothetical protein